MLTTAGLPYRLSRQLLLRTELLLHTQLITRSRLRRHPIMSGMKLQPVPARRPRWRMRWATVAK